MPCITHVLSFHHRKCHIIDTKKARYHDAVYEISHFVYFGKTHHLASSCIGLHASSCIVLHCLASSCMSCIGLHHLALSCIVLHHLALSRILLHHLAASCIVLHYLASSCIILHHLASSCIVLHHLAPSCIVLHHLTKSRNILHHLASSCIILHHLASSCIILHTETPINTTNVEDIWLPIPNILQTFSAHIRILLLKKARYHDAVYHICYFIILWKLQHKWPKKVWYNDAVYDIYHFVLFRKQHIILHCPDRLCTPPAAARARI